VESIFIFDFRFAIFDLKAKDALPRSPLFPFKSKI